MYIYIYIYPIIRRPLQSVERVRLHLLAYNIQSFSSSTPRSKALQRTSVQPVKVARQLKSRNPTLRAPRQLESRISGVRMLESWDLIILSSSIGDLLRCNRLPQDATGCPTFWPRIQQISLNRCSGPQGKQKDKHPSIRASKPWALEVGGRGVSLFNIYIYIYIYRYTKNFGRASRGLDSFHR